MKTLFTLSHIVVLVVALVAMISATASTAATSSFPDLRPSADNAVQTKAVVALLNRVLGEILAKNFSVQVRGFTSELGYDDYEITTPSPGHVNVVGSTGVAVTQGIYWYLKYKANMQVMWGWHGSGRQLRAPSVFPPLEKPERVTAAQRYRYYMNVCTVSYSMVWWDWDRWEQEIDWMALHGINLPLAFTGQEYVYWLVLAALGLSESDIDEYFSGPAFLAWNRMGNIHTMAGPLPSGWVKKQRDLQLDILKRQRELGMVTVLPGFAGFVPKALEKLYPNAKFRQAASWAGVSPKFTNNVQVQPGDPLFTHIGEVFIKIQSKVYGTDHIYNTDVFNEMNPYTNNSGYLREASAGVMSGIRAGDPKGIWLMQGWLFYEDRSFWGPSEIQAYLNGVSNDSMIILDLYADDKPVWSRTHSFYGKPFIWCMLHNFGGRRGLYGNLPRISTAPLSALHAKGSTMIGTGITPEAIETNPVVYEMMTEMGWRCSSPPVTDWLQDYIRRRYADVNADFTDAWDFLLQAAYTGQSIYKGLAEFPPAFHLRSDLTTNATDIVAAWRYLHAGGCARQGYARTSTYTYDVVDVGRQVLMNLFYDCYQVASTLSLDLHEASDFETISLYCIGILDDLDRLLATDVNYLLGQWTTRAQDWARRSETGSNSLDSLFDFNAKMQLTLWDPNGSLNTYASKQWSGLVSDYYQAHWSKFFRDVSVSMFSGVPMNWTKFEGEIFDMESKWVASSSSSYSREPSGDSCDSSSQLLIKYASPVGVFKTVLRSRVASASATTFSWTRDRSQLNILCSLVPSCAAFSTAKGALYFGKVNYEADDNAPPLFVKGEAM